MTFYKDGLLKNKLNIVYVLGLLFVAVSILAYKYSIISSYVVNVADEDQVIMWYGTMAALDNNIREPHFLGQKYGSMIESYVAIPFYLIGMPIEYALPMATVLLWFLPFALCSLSLAKNKQWIEAVIILGMSMIYGWQYDVLTNISRSFIGGFWLTFLGLLLIFKEHKSAKEIFAIIVFFTLGFWISEQTVTLVALAIFHILYKEDFFTNPKNFYKNFLAWEKEKKLALFVGLLFTFIFLGYCNYLFYYLNPDYNHHKIGSFKLRSRIFINNMKTILELCEAYSLVTIKGIPLCAIVIIGAFLKFWKRFNLKECLVLFGLSVLGILIIMCSLKSVDFTEPILLGRRRIYLFIPYIAIFLAYYTFNLKNISILINNKYGTKTINGIFVFLVASIVMVSGIKFYNFQNYYVYDEDIHTSNILRVRRVSVIKDVAREIRQIAKENRIQNVIFLEDCTYAYGTAAFNYGELRTYLTHYERKTEDYLFYKNNLFTGKILFVNCDAKGILSYKIEEFDKCNVIDYILHKYLRERHRYVPDELYQQDCM